MTNEKDREEARAVIKEINEARGKAYGFGKAAWSRRLLKEELQELNDGFYRMAIAVLLKYRAEAIQAERERWKPVYEALKRVIHDKKPGYHDCTDDGEPECAWCEANRALESILSDDQEATDECLRTKQELGAGCHDQYGFDQGKCYGR